MTGINKYHKPGVLQPSEGLNSFLQGISAAGEHESEGEFTVSLDRALDKLEKFQLSDPNLFVLNLVSTAVLLGATYLEATFRNDQARIDFDGELLSLEQLQTLWTGKEPALKELSVALSAARALDYQAILFQSGGAVRWEADGKPEFFEISTPRNSLTLFHRQSMSQKLLGKLQATPAATPKWFAPLRKSCQFAPLSISAGQYGASRTSLAIYAPAWYCCLPGFKLLKFVAVGDTMNDVYQMPAEETFSAVVGSTANSWAKEWSFVFRGITYVRSTSSIDVGGLGGIVYSEALSKDISHTDLVQNEVFDRIVEQLQEKTTTYIKEELSLKPLPPSRVKEWGKAGLWAGKRLYEAGQNREAARVEAWSYGHLAQSWSFARKLSLDPIARYEQPLVFLIDYLYWSGRQKLDEKIRFVTQETTLAPWIEGADEASLQVFLKFLLPLFPRETSWEMLRPLVEKLLETEFAVETLSKLEKNFHAIPPELAVPALKSILLTAGFLAEQRKLDFKDWLRNSLRTGFVPCTDRILESLTGQSVEEEAREVIQDFLSSRKTSAMLRAAGEFQNYLRKPGYTSLTTIQKHLAEALQNTKDPSQKLDIQALIGVFCGEVKPPNSTTFAWETHRAALLYGILERRPLAYELHINAHKKLEHHWLSHLLLGDATLAMRMDSAAHLHYAGALELNPTSAAAKEAFIETSPEEEQQELWIAHARSLGTHEVEDALAYREALALCSSDQNFAAWVKLRALTSLAEHQAGKSLTTVDENLFLQGNFVQVTYLSPVIVRHLIRRTRDKWPLAGTELPRLRLTSMLSRSTSALLSWKEEYLDGEETRL